MNTILKWLMPVALLAGPMLLQAKTPQPVREQLFRDMQGFSPAIM